MRPADGALALVLLVMPALQACRASESPGEGGAPARLNLPATFVGDLPCTECEAVRWHLDLLAEYGYELRREWVGQGRSRDEVGRWRLEPTGRTILLYGAAEMPLRLDVIGPDRLRVVDSIGGPGTRQPNANRELVSEGRLSPMDLALVLGGEMTYVADGPRFTECMTGRTYPIATEGDYPALERAYLDAVPSPGAKLYVTFEGRLLQRPLVAGAGTGRTVVIERFINDWPGTTCERAAAQASLSNTYWRVARLGGADVVAVEGRREPSVILRESGGRSEYSATAGCGKLAGRYAVEGESIRFSPPAPASPSCPPPLDSMERALMEALERAVGWRINANTLELYDVSGRPLALLEAVYL